MPSFTIRGAFTLGSLSLVAAQFQFPDFDQYIHGVYCEAVIGCTSDWSSKEGQACIKAWCEGPYGSCDKLQIAKGPCCNVDNPVTCFQQNHPRKVNVPGPGIDNMIPKPVPTATDIISSLSAKFEPCATVGSIVSKCSKVFGTSVPDTEDASDEDVAKCVCYQNGKYEPDVFDGNAQRCKKAVGDELSSIISEVNLDAMTDLCKKLGKPTGAVETETTIPTATESSSASGTSAGDSEGSEEPASRTSTAAGATTSNSSASLLTLHMSILAAMCFVATLITL